MTNFIYDLKQAYEQLDNDLVNQQVALELESATLGRERFLKDYERAKNLGGSDLTSNKVIKPLLDTLIEKMTKGIIDFTEKDYGRNKPRALKVIKEFEPDVLAYITISTTLSLCMKAKDKNIHFVALNSKINRYVFEELKYSKIREEEMGMFKAFLDEGINQRVGHTYKELYARKALANRNIEVDVFSSEDINEQLDVYTGVKLLEILIETTGLIKLICESKSNDDNGSYVVIDDKFIDVLNENAEYLAQFQAVAMPLVIPPKAWGEPLGGGYYTDSIPKVPFVRTHSRKALKRYEDVDMPLVYEAVNIAQNTKWRVNTRVLEVMQAMKNDKNPIEGIPSLYTNIKPVEPIDIDTNEEALNEWKKKMVKYYKQRNSIISRRLRFETTLETAERFKKYESIYFAYNLDWRGRLYPVSYFSPQSDDIGKALLTFSEGHPIGLDGFQWLKIHLANCCGIDKVTTDERIKWVESNHDNIMASAEDPTNYLWWAEQDDSPFQVLASCFEYAEVIKNGLNYKSHLPVAFDGACSGTQHFSAMLRDEVGGRAVNLIPEEKVNDIYGFVATECIRLMKEELETSRGKKGYLDSLEQVVDKKTGDIKEVKKLGIKTLNENWLKFGVTRNVTKQPTMTSSYGAKTFGYIDQIKTGVIKKAQEKGPTVFDGYEQQYAVHMATIVTLAISNVCVKSVQAMEWLQSCAGLLCKKVKDYKGNVLRDRQSIVWSTTDGFMISQEVFKREVKRIRTMFCGTHRKAFSYRENTKEIDIVGMKNGLAPNFVHSYDANHLRYVVRHSFHKYGISDLALIHDSFGCHASKAGKLFRAIRETMIDIYENNDVLEEFKGIVLEQLHETQLKDMFDLPLKGTLDLQGILKSKYAFM